MANKQIAPVKKSWIHEGNADKILRLADHPAFDEPDHLIPMSVEAEEAVLGACLLDSRVFPAMADIIDTADFFLHPPRLHLPSYAQIS